MSEVIELPTGAVSLIRGEAYFAVKTAITVRIIPVIR